MRSKQTTSADFGFRVGDHELSSAGWPRSTRRRSQRCACHFSWVFPSICLCLFFVSGCGNSISLSHDSPPQPSKEATDRSAGDPQTGTTSPSATQSGSGSSQKEPKRLTRGEMPEEWIEPQRERVFAIDTNSNKLDLTFDDLKFDIEVGEAFERSLLSEEVKALDGKQITLSGYMRPSFKATGLKGFIFVRDDKECCFGPQAAIYDCVRVKLRSGTSSDYIVRPFKVRGTFYLKEREGPDGAIWSIFNMKNVTIES